MRVHEACVSRKGKHEVQARASDVLISISGNGTPFSHGRKMSGNPSKAFHDTAVTKEQ